MALSISVPFSVVIPSGASGPMIQESATQDGPIADVVFRCNWLDRLQLCQDLLGTWVAGGINEFSGIAPPGVVSRIPAFLYPPCPSMFCTDILSIEPLGSAIPYIATSGDLWVGAELATVTARFSLPAYTQDGSDQGGQPYTIVKPSISGEIMTLPDTTYFFADNTPTGTPIGFMMPQMEYTWTRVRMPFIPDWVFATKMGKVNSDSFALSQTFTAAPGTVLFMPGNPDITGHPEAMFSYGFGFPLSYSVEYKFLWKSIPWNNFLHPDRTSGFLPVTDGNGKSPYPSTPFTGVFP